MKKFFNKVQNKANELATLIFCSSIACIVMIDVWLITYYITNAP